MVFHCCCNCDVIVSQWYFNGIANLCLWFCNMFKRLCSCMLMVLQWYLDCFAKPFQLFCNCLVVVMQWYSIGLCNCSSIIYAMVVAWFWNCISILLQLCFHCVAIVCLGFRNNILMALQLYFHGCAIVCSRLRNGNFIHRNTYWDTIWQPRLATLVKQKVRPWGPQFCGCRICRHYVKYVRRYNKWNLSLQRVGWTFQQKRPASILNNKLSAI